MPFALSKRVNLLRLILALVVLSALVTLANALHASYSVQREQLIRATPEANRVYAAKLASGTETFMQTARQQLAFSAGVLGADRRPATVEAEAERLKMQSQAFNSVLVVDEHGTVLSISPPRQALLGKPLGSEGSKQALALRRPLVSRPYVSAAGNLIVTLSHPIFRADGSYAGYVAGGIYLHGDNILKKLLDEQYYRDGSYLYVVDPEGHLIYHPDRSRLGEQVTGNPVIEQVRAGHSGAQRLVNSTGTDMLAGYAPVPLLGWGVVAQRPTAVALAPLSELMGQVVKRMLPLAVILLLLIGWFANQISQPLWRLARNAREEDVGKAIDQIGAVKAWYFEVQNLKQAVLSSFGHMQARIGELDEATSTDPLTGLQNRRGLEAVLGRWSAARRGFGVIVLDIDHFKRINDTWGHDMGDQVIRRLAEVMRSSARPGDFLCRTGGEEFLVLLPDASGQEALRVAERLRAQIAQHQFDQVGTVTISAGVAAAGEGSDPKQALQAADSAMYQAKQEGRNRVVGTGAALSSHG